MFELEAQEGCSGVCAPANFWFTQSVTLDSPTFGCASAMGFEEHHQDFIVKLQRENPYPAILFWIKFISKGIGAATFVIMVMKLMNNR